MTTLEAQLEKAFNEQEPVCQSCGWANAYYELEWTEVGIAYGMREFHSQCRSKDAEDSENHRGYCIYLEAR